MDIKRGMILAAGLGTRLAPLTWERPKPLLEVLGKPLICYTLTHMQRMGIKDVIINTHHLGQKLKKALSQSFIGMNLHFVYEPTILDTGGGLKNVEQFLFDSQHPFLLMNADAFLDFHPQEMLAEHYRDRADITMLLKTVMHPEEFGIIGTDSKNCVQSIANHIERSGHDPLQSRMFCGVHILNHKIFSELAGQGIPCKILDAHARLIKRGETVVGVEQTGYFSDVGTSQRLFQTNMDALANRTLFSSFDPFEHFFEFPTVPGVFVGRDARISPKATVVAPCVVDSQALIEDHAVIGPFAVVGKRVEVSQGAQIQHSIILSDTKMTTKVHLRNKIIGPDVLVNINH